MTVGLLEIDVFSEQFHNLKDKRRLVSSLKERLQNKFNIAVAESDFQELWQKAQLSIVSLAPSRSVLEARFRQIEEFIYLNYALEITRLQVRYF